MLSLEWSKQTSELVFGQYLHNSSFSKIYRFDLVYRVRSGKWTVRFPLADEDKPQEIPGSILRLIEDRRRLLTKLILTLPEQLTKEEKVEVDDEAD